MVHKVWVCHREEVLVDNAIFYSWESKGPIPLLGGSSQLGSVVNNHGDRKSPKWGCSPYKWPKWLINRGY